MPVENTILKMKSVMNEVDATTVVFLPRAREVIMALKSTLVPFTEGPQVVGARLCHFGSASSELLQSHKHWITQYFLPVMKKTTRGVD